MSYSIDPEKLPVELISVFLKSAINTLLTDVANEHCFHYLGTNFYKSKVGVKAKQLLIRDDYDSNHKLDAIITNQSIKPIIIFELKCLPHINRQHEITEQICAAHLAVRRRYHSIRSSIAVLAGSWSGSSIAMMKSNDINIFQIPFSHIIDLLQAHQIDFAWGEKEKEKAYQAWNNYNGLSPIEQQQIGEEMIAIIRDPLVSLVEKILDDTVKREVEKVIIEIVSNLGEVKIFEFDSVEEAIGFLDEEDLDKLFLTVNSVTLFDPPPTYDD
jgi:hypothetical protein